MPSRDEIRTATRDLRTFFESLRVNEEFIVPVEVDQRRSDPITRPCGLYCIPPKTDQPPHISRNSCLPASAISLNAVIRDQIACVTLRARYSRGDEEMNAAQEGQSQPFRGPMEFEFELPLDEKSAVTRFKAIIGEHRLRSELKSKSAARATYQAAVSRGEKAALMESVNEAPNRFKFSLGNIAFGESAEIECEYLTTLDSLGPKLSWIVPLWQVPKYILSKGLPEGRQLSGGNELLSSIIGLRIHAEVHTATALERVTCNYSNGIGNQGADYQFSQAANSQQHAVIDFSATHPDGLIKPFELGIFELSPYSPHCLLEYCPRTKTGCVQISMIPPSLPLATQSQLACEILILIDRSGSMSGESIAAVRETMQVMLKSLPVNCRFNIIGFGDDFQLLFPQSRAYDDDSLAVAAAHCETVDADLGGTELLPPFRYIYKQPPLAGYPRLIFLLTDGGCSGVEQIAKIARANIDTTRLFTFGIGSGVDRSLVTRVAEAGNGKCEFVSGSSEDIRASCLRQLNAALQPSYNKVSVDWAEFKTTSEPGAQNERFYQIPQQIPGIFPDSKLIIYGMNVEFPADKLSLSESSEGQWSSLTPSQYATIQSDLRRIIVAAQSNIAFLGGHQVSELEFELEFDCARISIGETLHKLAARARIAELQRSGSNKTQILEIAMKWGLVSSETSIVCVEEKSGEAQERTVEEQMQIKTQSRPEIDYLECEKESDEEYEEEQSDDGDDCPAELCVASSAPIMEADDCEKLCKPQFDADMELEEEKVCMRKSKKMARPMPAPAPKMFSGMGPPCPPPAPAPARAMASFAPSNFAPITSSFVQGSSSSSSSSSSSVGTGFTALVNLQSATGAWKLDDRLVKVMHDCAPKSSQKGLADLEALPKSLGLDPASMGILLALFLLRSFFAGRESEWKLLAGKGQAAIKKYQIPEDKLKALDETLAQWMC